MHHTLEPQVTTTEPADPRACAPQREKPHPATESSPPSRWLEKSPGSTEDPAQPNVNKPRAVDSRCVGLKLTLSLQAHDLEINDSTFLRLGGRRLLYLLPYILLLERIRWRVVLRGFYLRGGHLTSSALTTWTVLMTRTKVDGFPPSCTTFSQRAYPCWTKSCALDFSYDLQTFQNQTCPTSSSIWEMIPGTLLCFRAAVWGVGDCDPHPPEDIWPHLVTFLFATSWGEGGHATGIGGWKPERLLNTP